MNNPNTASQQPERNLQSNESLLDNERILATPAIADQVHEYSKVDQRQYDTDLRDMLGSGVLYDIGPDGSLFPSSRGMINPKNVKDTFWSVCKETVTNPNAKPVGENGIFDDPSLTAASYASAVVGNHPNPETFMTKMYEQFRSTHQNASEAEKTEFSEGVDTLAAMLYGKRCIEYFEQCQDLNLAGPELEKTEHDQRNRQIDVEILGKNYRIRRTVREFALNVRNTTALSKANVRNLMASPREAWRKHRLDAKESKHQRLQLKAISTRNSFLREYRQDRADRYVDKVADARERYDEHRDLMNKRVDIAIEKTEVNAAMYQAHIDRYKSEKQAKIANRRFRRELKASGAGFVERQKALQHFKETTTKEQLNRLGRAACIEKVVADKFNDIARQHRRAEGALNGYETLAVTLESDIKLNKNSVQGLTSKRFRLISQSIPTAERVLQTAENALQSADPSDTDAYEQFQQDVNEHRQRLEKLKAAADEAQVQIDRLTQRERELTREKARAERAAVDARRNVADADIRQQAARDAFDRQQGSFERTRDRLKKP